MNSDTLSFGASNSDHNRTATSKSRSDRSFWGRFSYHSSQLSAKLARSFPSRKKDDVPPPRVLADELDEGREAWERIHAAEMERIHAAEKMERIHAAEIRGEEKFGRDSFHDAVDRDYMNNTWISEEHKTIVDEMREIRDAIELKDHEIIQQLHQVKHP